VAQAAHLGVVGHVDAPHEGWVVGEDALPQVLAHVAHHLAGVGRRKDWGANAQHRQALPRQQTPTFYTGRRCRRETLTLELRHGVGPLADDGEALVLAVDVDALLGARRARGLAGHDVPLEQLAQFLFDVPTRGGRAGSN